MLKTKSIVLILVSMFFVACGGESSSSSSSETKEVKVVDNSQVASNPPQIKNIENLPVSQVKSLK